MFVEISRLVARVIVMLTGHLFLARFFVCHWDFSF
jgi:hypothetical protein